jgi:hypothetical protein
MTKIDLSMMDILSSSTLHHDPISKSDKQAGPPQSIQFYTTLYDQYILNGIFKLTLKCSTPPISSQTTSVVHV